DRPLLPRLGVRRHRHEGCGAARSPPPDGRMLPRYPERDYSTIVWYRHVRRTAHHAKREWHTPGGDPAAAGAIFREVHDGHDAPLPSRNPIRQKSSAELEALEPLGKRIAVGLAGLA